MGSTLSTTVGYGIVLPWGEDDEFDFVGREFYAPFLEEAYLESPDEFSRPETDDVLDEIVKRFPLLDYDSSYFYDYSGGAALFIKSTVQTFYGVDAHKVNVIPGATPRELKQLKEVAELLGVPFESSWLVVVSYG